MSDLDDHIRETVNRLLDSLRGRLESELGSCQDELIQAARDATTRVAAEAAEGATAEARRDTERQIAELRESSARDAEEERTRFNAQIEELQRVLDETREESQRRIEESQRQIEDRQIQIDALGRDLDIAKQQADSAKQQADSATQQVDSAKQECDALTRDLESARAELDSTRDDVEATLRDIETSRRDSDAARFEIRRLTEALRGKDARATQAMRLPDAVQALDGAATFGEVLETLAVQSGREAGRAAVFLVKGERLRDWRTVGFDLASDAPRLDINLNDSGPMAEAVRSGQCVRPQPGAIPDFAHSDERREAAAWPVSVGGSVVAVLYADGPVADTSDEPYWPAFLDVLARHAGRVLEGITVRHAAGLVTGTTIRLASSSVGRQSSGSIQ